jgi:TonB family protein
MVPISELTRQDLGLHWHEAVAIVAETADMLLARGLTSVPDLAAAVLTPDGTLHVLDEGPPTFDPAQRLGGMLDVLLASSPCPPELRQLTADSLADPPVFATVEEFAEALAFFERPGRRELLAAVAARGSEAALDARAHTEMERLEARARSQPRKTEPGAETPRSHKQRFAVYAVAAVLLILGVVAGAFAALRATGSQPTTLTERVRARVDRIATKGLEIVGLRTPAPPASAPVPATGAPPRVAAKPARRAPKDQQITISVKELASGSVSTLASATKSASPNPVVHDESVYTADAEGIEPAVLVRPHLPSHPPLDTPSEQIGILDIVVSATGAVEQVRLISTSNRYQDRMIVAAAKAWQFEPATKDGQRVRYRTQIRITL